MKFLFKLTSILLVLLVSCCGANLSSNFENDDDEEVSVFIGFKRGKKYNPLLRSTLSDRIVRFHAQYKLTNAIHAIVKKSNLRLLKSLIPDIEYIELDPMVYLSSESYLYGYDMVQANTSIIPSPSNIQSTVCSDPNSFKIGIIDTAFAMNHPDLPCGHKTKKSSNHCIGKDLIPFRVSRWRRKRKRHNPNGEWYNPVSEIHGTHVAGTIGAISSNQYGVQGMVNDGKFCFIFGRAFNNTGYGLSSWSLSAVEWMLSKGVNVINMSYGRNVLSLTEQRIMQKAYDAGVVLVAAAGNAGDSTLSYPASYSSVVSVAAIDSAYNRASFSQNNSAVDLSAPGGDILSTIPLNMSGSVLIITENINLTGSLMQKSVIRATTNGTLVDCGLALTKCPGPGGHICLIQRGNLNITYEEKALNCQDSGGVGAVIYHNNNWTKFGSLGTPTKVTIPTYTITQANGIALQSTSINSTVTIVAQMGYGYLSGTSMACPHVVGIVARIWRPCRNCTNDQVIQCLQTTALDLGESGRDDNYGYGLIQGEKAYLCLVNTLQCCT